MALEHHTRINVRERYRGSLTHKSILLLLLFEVAGNLYFISFSQYLKKDWREIEMKPGSYLGKRRFDWIVQID